MFHYYTKNISLYYIFGKYMTISTFPEYIDAISVIRDSRNLRRTVQTVRHRCLEEDGMEQSVPVLADRCDGLWVRQRWLRLRRRRRRFAIAGRSRWRRIIVLHIRHIDVSACVCPNSFADPERELMSSLRLTHPSVNMVRRRL